MASVLTGSSVRFRCSGTAYTSPPSFDRDAGFTAGHMETLLMTGAGIEPLSSGRAG
jgi:hypothetical protein